MGARAIERRTVQRRNSSFQVSLIHDELRELGLIEQTEDGEWEFVGDGEVVVEHHGTDEPEVRIRLPERG